MTDRELMQQAYEVPPHEQLASVPENARLVIDDSDGMGTQFIPVGRLCHEAAAELRRLHEEVMLLRGDPGNRYAHRLAIELECALLAPEQANANLLDEYHNAVREWMEANGQPYVSGFGKD